MPTCIGGEAGIGFDWTRFFIRQLMPGSSPGHLAGIVSVATDQQRGVEFYRAALTGVAKLSHLTIEVEVKVG